MSVTLGVDLATESPERVAADLLLVPFFSGDRPLRGPASRIDWRLCGLLSRQLRRGLLPEGAGETALVAGDGRFFADRVLLIGLGPRAGFSAEGLARSAEQGAGCAVALRSGRLALALPRETLSGVAADSAAVSVVAGACRALAAQPAALQLRLVVSEEEASRVRTGLAEAARQARGQPVAVRLLEADAPPRQPVRGPARPQPAAPGALQGKTPSGP